MTDIEGSTIQVESLEKDFTVLSRQLLQDPDISADAQMVATFLLSLPAYKKDGTSWDIYPRHVWNAKNIGRDRVYKAFDELCILGYMKKIMEKRGNLNGKTTYFISNLKKYLRDPESQDQGIQDHESQDYKEKEGKKNIKEKTNNPLPQSSDKAASQVVCSFKNELLENTPLTAPQKMQIQTLFGHLDNNVFRNSISAYLAYAEKNEIDDHFATVRSALGGKDGVPWVITATDNDREKVNRTKTFNAFSRYDNGKLGGSIKWNVAVTSKYIEFACGSSGHIFEYKSKIFKEEINEFLERAEIDIRI